jgi:SAM-dependent methyltransferase
MFNRTAHLYDKLYAFKDYEAASRKIKMIVRERCPHARTLLDIGCGTGKHLEFLQSDFIVEGLDLDADLIEIAHRRLADVPLHVADMSDFHLPRRFDVVTCLFSAIAYVKTREKMQQTLSCIASHLNPGGVVLIEPWISLEQYWTGRVAANFIDEDNLKVAWMYVSELRGSISVFNIHYMVGTPTGIEQFSETHEMGLFTLDEYAEAFTRVGLRVEHDPIGLFNRGLFIGFGKD